MFCVSTLVPLPLFVVPFWNRRMDWWVILMYETLKNELMSCTWGHFTFRSKLRRVVSHQGLLKRHPITQLCWETHFPSCKYFRESSYIHEIQTKGNPSCFLRAVKSLKSANFKTYSMHNAVFFMDSRDFKSNNRHLTPLWYAWQVTVVNRFG